MPSKCARSPNDPAPVTDSVALACLYCSLLPLYTIEDGVWGQLTGVKFRSARKAVSHAEQ